MESGMTEIIVSVTAGLILSLLGYIVKKLDSMKKEQIRTELLFKCEHKAMDYSLEINLDGDYIKERDMKLRELLDKHNFIKVRS
jgi:hypothetical protein